ncbi:hypothetical protein KIN20_005436 [Parelaphostrongylus tenuis]|uniref:Uncharacterized protein n=1 Tax=Parelaphostrongylus tenuis TaxID=148309 RepID=A0AAD5M0C3_PARTN|nr:hypothetical protein KIN20_005436 [Parelaphostrongylus tenuis]
MDEIRAKVEAFYPEPVPSDINDYESNDCPRTWNPTVLGALDGYAPLRSFKEEVVVESSQDGLTHEVLKKLQSVLEDYARSPST